MMRQLESSMFDRGGISFDASQLNQVLPPAPSALETPRPLSAARPASRRPCGANHSRIADLLPPTARPPQQISQMRNYA